MTDRGYDKANGVHMGSEHICNKGLYVTFDIGRYDECPLECGYKVDQQADVIELMTPEETKRYSDTLQTMLASQTFVAIRDPDMIGPMRMQDLKNSIAARLKLDVTDINLFLDKQYVNEQLVFRGTIRKTGSKDKPTKLPKPKSGDPAQ